MIEVPYIVQLKESANTVDLILKYSLKLFYSSGISIMKKWQLRNCSYENIFFLLLSRSFAFIYELYPGWAKFILVGY